jgi:hypothetical protein
MFTWTQHQRHGRIKARDTLKPTTERVSESLTPPTDINTSKFLFSIYQMTLGMIRDVGHPTIGLPVIPAFIRCGQKSIS